MFYDDLPFAERGGWDQPPQRRADVGIGPYDGTRRADVGIGPYGSRSSGAGSSPLRPGAAAQHKAPVVDYRPGDTVQHSSFGRGMILRVTKMGNDAMLEIAFDDKGTKRLLANTASAHMKKL